MIRILAIGALIVCLFSANGQVVDWKRSTQWRLLEPFHGSGGTIHGDSLNYSKYLVLEQDSMKRYLQDVSPISAARSNGAVWMGEYWVTCNYEDSAKVVRVSNYGGFFLDTATGIYYEIPMPLRAEWHTFLVKEFIDLQNKSNREGQ